MARVRLGVALLLPRDQAAEVQGLRRALGDPALDRIPPHLTLVPPVNVRAEDMPGALLRLREAAAATAPFSVELGPPSTFLPDSPVLFLAVDDAAGAVARLRERVFHPPLARPLTWPFVPHMTLLDGGGPGRLEAARWAMAGFRIAVEWAELHLLQEEPGRIWRSLASAVLGGSAVIGRGGLPLEISRSTQPDPAARRFAEQAWAELDLAETGGLAPRVDMAFTARRSGQVVGVATGRAEGGVGHLSELIVASAVRGEGVGHHLLAAFESWAAGEGVTRLALRTPAGGPAEGFYARRGWREEARLTDWYGGRSFVQLRRDLAP
ncbi:MAG TPA: GNAT family N-acetyltransferase [Acidimicrobiales bacterium]